MKAAIVCLTKGYPDVRYYETLIRRNLHNYENFNKNLNAQYPLLILHEGNIPDLHQKFILSNEKNNHVEFINIQPDFLWPNAIDFSEVKDNRFHLGYRLMCRFHSSKIWKYVTNYDYILRIDEDVMMGPLNYNIFEYMDSNNLDYMPSRFMHEYHDLTNETLPKGISKYLDGLWKESDYDQTVLWIPYTNLYAANVNFFKSNKVKAFLDNVTEDKNFLINRWGDAPMHGICLKVFSEPSKVKTIHEFYCLHGSHHCITRNGRAIQGIMSEYEAKYFDCVPSGKGDMHYIARNKT